ncbi:MAG: ribokinase [Aquihabitans sp.]
MSGRVWVVGSLNVDRPWRVERHPAVGETVTGSMLDPVPGGKGLNEAVAAARSGAHVSLVGCVGDDHDGEWLRGVAADSHIELVHVLSDPTLPTGSALIVVADDGANTVTVSPGANAVAAFPSVSLSADDVVCAQLEVPVETVAAALLAAHEAGARSVLNPSPIGAGVSLVPSADVVVVNEHEAAFLSKVDVEPLAQAQAIRTGDQTVVVTLGAGGVVSSGPSGDHVVPGIPVHAVDTTGAGDCFVGVLAASLADGIEMLPALERANLAASIAVTRPGAVDAMPHAAELLD